MSYVFSFTFFSRPLVFTLHWWSIAFLILSLPLQNFHVALPAKKCLLCFLSLALDLRRPFSHWASLACRLLPLFSVSPLLYIPNLRTWQLLYTTRMQKQFPLSVFVFIDSLVVPALQDAGGYAISHQNNLELYLGYHTCWLSYFTLIWLCCGRTVRRSVYGHVISKFSRMGRLLHFLTHGIPLCALRARELSY